MSMHAANDAGPVGGDCGDQAIDWLVLLHSGHADAGDRGAFARWRAADPAHEAAACAAEALWADVGATRAAAQVRPVRHGGLWRGGMRRAVMAGALAASVVLALAGGIAPVSRLFADHATAIGESRRVVLPDGSVAVLNTASALSVAYSASARRVALLDGEAVFEVAKDAARPFVVEAGGGSALAVGTVYGVRLRDGGAGVTVAEGVVVVTAPDGTARRLAAGQRAEYGPGPVSPAHGVDAGSESAWMRGKLIFNRRPLGDVMSEVERYHHGRIVVADRALRQLEVTGVFDLADADGVLRSVQQSLDVQVLRLPLLTVLY